MGTSNIGESEMMKELIARTNNVLLYEDYDLQNMALETIPIELLSHNASEKAAALKSTCGETVSEEDLVILELLQWFKFSFFSWVDAPKCEVCGITAIKAGIVDPDPHERQWEAKIVELYHCTQCQRSVRFPRYNHPQKLLETRRGRCGEWATCFTFLCRSLDYEARLVSDWNDHVWTEVYSTSQKRWVHCDACENAYDKPLMYELGWKKKISYVMAFSKDEVQDVTWRYCTNFNEVLSRRKQCREEFLLAAMASLNKTLQKDHTPERKRELLYLKIAELVSFLTPPSATGEFGGRTSGSAAWRLARGEYHTEKKTKHVFELWSDEISQKYFHLKYSCAADRYVRASSKASPDVKEWDSLTHDSANIFRKTEQDWNMAYLCRKEGSPNGFVCWKFDFGKSGLAIDSLALKLEYKTFENGTVSWVIDSGKLNLPLKDDRSVTLKDLQGLSEFTLTAQLSGGHGPVAWQHAQLFRQPLNSHDYPFEVQITFMDKPGASSS